MTRTREGHHPNSNSTTTTLASINAATFSSTASTAVPNRPSSSASNAYRRPSSSSSTRSVQHVNGSGSSPAASSPVLNHHYALPHPPPPPPSQFPRPQGETSTFSSHPDGVAPAPSPTTVASTMISNSPSTRSNNGLGPPPATTRPPAVSATDSQPSSSHSSNEFPQPQQRFRSLLNVESSLPSLETSHLFDSTRPRYPNQTHFLHLVSIFFDNLSCHFPFLDRATVTQQAEEGTLSAILANCIAGLAVRLVHGRFLLCSRIREMSFSTSDNLLPVSDLCARRTRTIPSRFSDREELLSTGPRYIAGEPFCDMAKVILHFY